MKPIKVEIVPARRRGVTGYANVGRGTALGNPFSPEIGDGNIALCVVKYELAFYKGRVRRESSLKLLDRDWPDGIVRLGCPCNGHEKGQPCHATVIKEFLEAEIERRSA